jgi:transcriptional regulator with XRE-family HTH domain
MRFLLVFFLAVSSVLVVINSTGGNELSLVKEKAGERFKEERERLGYRTRDELSEACGIEISHIIHFEDRNVRTKQIEHIHQLSKLGFDHGYWMAGRRLSKDRLNPKNNIILDIWMNADEDIKKKFQSLFDQVYFIDENE